MRRGVFARGLLVLLLIFGLLPPICHYEPRRPWNGSQALTFTPLTLPSRRTIARELGPFELAGAWQMTSPRSNFGGYSALIARPDGRLLAISDFAFWLAFSPPSTPAKPPARGVFALPAEKSKQDRDFEAATSDPATGAVWTAREGINAITRFSPTLRTEATVRPAAMADWADWAENAGPEAMVRLADGRFILLAEGFDGLFEDSRHNAVLFGGDPLRGGKATRFAFAGAPGYSVTDMAQLPDGRVLILMRRLVWPFPLRFSGRIFLADPTTIRAGAVWRGIQLARLDPPLPVDNFEGIAIVPRDDGRVTIWLISDANSAATQRTLLWKLVADPAKLSKPGPVAPTDKPAH
jgi:hypothetical protein